jgi:hypothetical protein
MRQYAGKIYRDMGGEYSKELTPAQKSLKKWTEEDWQTKSGLNSVMGENPTYERYLPKRKIKLLTDKEYEKTSKKKKEDTLEGKQYSKQPVKIQKKLKGKGFLDTLLKVVNAPMDLTNKLLGQTNPFVDLIGQDDLRSGLAKAVGLDKKIGLGVKEDDNDKPILHMTEDELRMYVFKLKSRKSKLEKLLKVKEDKDIRKQLEATINEAKTTYETLKSK